MLIVRKFYKNLLIVPFPQRSCRISFVRYFHYLLQNCILWLILFKVIAASFSLSPHLSRYSHFHQPLRAAILTPPCARACRLGSYAVFLPLQRKAASGILIIGHVLWSVNEAQSQLLPFPLGRTEHCLVLAGTDGTQQLCVDSCTEFKANEDSEAEASTRLLPELNSAAG